MHPPDDGASRKQRVFGADNGLLAPRAIVEDCANTANKRALQGPSGKGRQMDHQWLNPEAIDLVLSAPQISSRMLAISGDAGVQAVVV
jgi:hypothetical protein